MPSLWPQVHALESIGWKGSSDAYKLSSDLHTGCGTCAPHSHTNKNVKNKTKSLVLYTMLYVSCLDSVNAAPGTGAGGVTQ